MQLLAEIVLLLEETRNYDTLLERAAPPIAVHTGGGCVLGLLSDDAATLTPLGLFHPDRDANDALAELSGGAYTPLGGLEDAVLREGRGRVVELDPDVFAERPGVPRYIDITGHRAGVVVPMRARGRSIGVLWVSSGAALGPDDVNFLMMVGSRLALAVDHLRYVEGDQVVERPAAEGPVAALTAREREILRHVALGMTSREIAEEFVVSSRTVEWHRARIQGKLGVSGRAEMTRVAREAGLVA